MALFGRKKNKEVKSTVTAKRSAPKTVVAAKVPASTSVAVTPPMHSGNMTGSMLRPRVTEKSGLLSQSGVYTFEVSKDANKQSIAIAIRQLYKVTPVKVAIINAPDKNVFVRGRRGVVSGARKALVTLKKGDKIDFV